MKKAIGLIIAVFVIIGCASVGHKLDQGAVDRIQKGATRSQVFDLIGMPDKAFYKADGDLIWSYIYVPATVKPATVSPAVGSSAGIAKEKQRTLTITFGPDEVVKNVVSGDGGKEAGTDLSPGGKAQKPDTEENKKPK